MKCLLCRVVIAINYCRVYCCVSELVAFSLSVVKRTYKIRHVRQFGIDPCQ